MLVRWVLLLGLQGLWFGFKSDEQKVEEDGEIWGFTFSLFQFSSLSLSIQCGFALQLDNIWRLLLITILFSRSSFDMGFDCAFLFVFVF